MKKFGKRVPRKIGNDEEDEKESGPVIVKKSNAPKVPVQRDTTKKRLVVAKLPTREREEDESGPDYSAAALKALKDGTPSTPLNLSCTDGDEEKAEAGAQPQTLDLASKFGTSLARYQQPSAIPSAAEIAEKKARRARLAKEQAAEGYISLDPDDPMLDDEDGDPNVTRDEHGKLILKPKDEYGMAESRLVREDEDIMENFDEFTEDGKIHLGRKAEQEAARKRRAEMAAQIAEAEGADDEDDGEESDESEKERNAAFEAAQTRHGTYAENTTSDDPYKDARPKTPPIITPLPTLDGVIKRLRRQLGDMQAERAKKLQEMELLQREKIRLGEEEVRIQRALKETAEKFKELRRKKGLLGEDDGDRPEQQAIEAAPAPGSMAAMVAATEDEW
jgi:hypothetical protein